MIIENITASLQQLSQHEKLAIRVVSKGSSPLPDDVTQGLRKPHRKSHYFFLLVLEGSSMHMVDMQERMVTRHQMLFLQPHQIHLPSNNHASEYFKMIIDQHAISMLPGKFAFLLDPLNNPIINFDDAAAMRLKNVFRMLSQLLENKTADTNILLSYLNNVLTECNHSYFTNERSKTITNEKLAGYIQFKQLIEEQFAQQPSINDIAEKLATNTSNLYYTVKHFSGISPKEYITNRIILEAQRKLYYSETSIKELAFELGFNDPDYFSRLYKKTTGKSVTQFLQEVQDLSGSDNDLSSHLA